MKTRLNIQLKLYYNGKLTLATRKRIKSKILATAQVKPWHNAYLKVNYGNGFYNDAHCYGYQDLKRALSIFTEKTLISI